jgi:hypothetical protein
MHGVLGNPAAFIYGMITIGTLLAAESATRETYPRTVAAVAIATLLYWLVHGYAHFIAQRLRESRPVELSELAHAMRDELAIVLGGAPPLIALAIAWLAGASLNTGVAAAIWVDVGVIFLIEIASGIRAEQRGRALVVQTVLGATLGVLIIVLRLVLH